MTLLTMRPEFVMQDKCGFRGGDTNLRRYVHNNPTNAVDPSGLQGQRIPIIDTDSPDWIYETPPQATVNRSGPPLNIVDLGLRKGQYGAIQWPVRWELGRAADAQDGGYVIQEIKAIDFEIVYFEEKAGQTVILRRVTPKTLFGQGGDVTSDLEELLKSKRLIDLQGRVGYHEAWRVDPGKTTPTETATPGDLSAYKVENKGPIRDASDIFGIAWAKPKPAPPRKNLGANVFSRGYLRIAASVEYFDKMPVGQREVIGSRTKVRGVLIPNRIPIGMGTLGMKTHNPETGAGKLLSISRSDMIAPSYGWNSLWWYPRSLPKSHAVDITWDKEATQCTTNVGGNLTKY
jgi:hypothetical protein